jgi:hypothetical protein
MLDPNMILPKDIALPRDIDDAIAMSKSLAIWIEFIKAKIGEAEGSDPFNSYGGNIDAHLTYLTYWFKTEAIRSFSFNKPKQTEELK